MTDSIFTNDLAVMKTDEIGHVQASPEQHEACLDAFEPLFMAYFGKGDP